MTLDLDDLERIGKEAAGCTWEFVERIHDDREFRFVLTARNNWHAMIDELRRLRAVTAPEPPQPYWYEDERLCGHCDKYTQQKCHDSGHERDSSGDRQECLTCGWTRTGHTDWEPPSHIPG